VIETRLSQLSKDFLPDVCQFLALLTQQRIYVVIIETKRTLKRQIQLLEDGKTLTLDSDHLSGDAIDLAPVKLYERQRVREIQWDTSDPLWERIGSIAESLGLEWGGRWTGFRDFVHFQKGNPHEKASSLSSTSSDSWM
jgi:peptidoglycan L-alanyl-D-glutamate endopeptidase CwlK